MHGEEQEQQEVRQEEEEEQHNDTTTARRTARRTRFTRRARRTRSALIQQKRNMLVKLRTLKQTTNKCNLALEEISDEVDRLETQMNEVISSTQDNATKKKNFLSIKFQLADESNNGRVTFILDSLNVTYSMEQRRSATRLKELRRAMAKREFARKPLNKPLI